MTIFVDQLQTYGRVKPEAQRYGSRWCHMTTDGPREELHSFAERIGLKRAWFQDHVRRYLKHYDLTPSKHALAVKLGAVEVDLLEHVKQRMKEEEEMEKEEITLTLKWEEIQLALRLIREKYPQLSNPHYVLQTKEEFTARRVARKITKAMTIEDEEEESGQER
jgi:hypothetical protein